MSGRRSRAATSWGVLLVVCCGACGPRPVTVAVSFDDQWRIRGAAVSAADRAVIKQAAFETLRRAFSGYAVEFIDGTAGDAVVRVEHTPYARDSIARMSFGAAGVTYAVAAVSSVRVDVLVEAELAAVGCGSFEACPTPRGELLSGLGRGIGATAAHELGHQARFRFGRDIECADCYDGRSLSRQHFFGEKRWSPAAAAAMGRVLPRSRVGGD